EDFKQYNKLLHVLRSEPEKNIITVDDDVYYPEDIIDRLIQKSMEFPGCIVCHSGRFLSFDKDGRLRMFGDMLHSSGSRRVMPSLCLIPEGVGGVLYPPHTLDEIVFDSELFMRITPRNDDLWFKMASLKNNTLCVQVEKWNTPLNVIPGSQSTGLYKANFEGGNDSQLKACFEEYPELLEKAKAEFFSVPDAEEIDMDESKRSTYFHTRSDYTGKKLLFYKYKYCFYRALSALCPNKPLRQKAGKYRRRIDASKFWQKMIISSPDQLSVKELLCFDGKKLIRETYNKFLHRMPSSEEEAIWYEPLLSGLPAISFISSVCFSPEGKQVAEPVKNPFLLRTVGRLLGAKHIHGKIARYVYSLFRISSTKRMVRNASMRLDDLTSCINRIDQDLTSCIRRIDQDLTSCIRRIDQDLTSRINQLETTLTTPQLPFSLLTPSEPFLKRAENRVGKPAPDDSAERNALFYTYFSEIGGPGHEECLLEHHKAYLPHIDKNLAASYPFLDIGCGAGEFLSFLKNEGMKSIGIDFNAQEVERCCQKGLEAYCREALDFLKKNDGLYCGISLLQVIEHIERSCYIELIMSAKKRLAKGGVLIVETLNPLHAIALDSFYKDPTHCIPVPHYYLAFLAQWCGFTKVDVLFLMPSVTRLTELNESCYYFDYAILARND
ncbi:MAG: class I SAM-dependent methyltransferase, partial [Holosporaceae bacterium]|nr:class I SAM-dependent methyltransferase [Holosporaceae bacterium]